jgi:PAS domain S-box-containing protein
LIVDDHEENRIALRAVLSSPDYRIVEAGSGREALRHLLNEEFAVLLVDVVMPQMNGLEFATAIKERERTAGIPILFLTAEAKDTDCIYTAYQVGAVDYLVKPIVPEIVRSKVRVFAELFRQRKRIEEQAQMLVEVERNESELRVLELRLASERRYRSLADSVPGILWTAQPDGRIDYFNRRWFEYTGLSAERTASSWEGALHPEDAPRFRNAWRQAVRVSERFQIECRLRRASDGEFRRHLCRALPERSAIGQILSWLGTMTDIEDQQRAHAALADFKETLDAVLDAVFILDPDEWLLLYVNRGASVLLGYSEDELRKLRPIDFIAEHDRDSFRQILAPLRRGVQKVITIETTFRQRDGTVVPVEVSLQLVHLESARLVAIARDITERKRAQIEREILYREAVAAIRARDEFLSVASHELRTPLVSLQLQIQMLLSPPRRRPHAILSPEQQRGKLQLAARQVERLARLVSGLMDISKLTVGRFQLELEEVDLSAIVRDVIGRLADEGSRAHSPIDVSAEAPVIGKWDRLRVEQVVTNLLTNALKFGGGKPIRVEVEARGGAARLIVCDRGIGIPPEDVERIFDRYEQAISSREYGGLGLGLYIVHQIVEAHGGTIRVESEPGVGSQFTIDLPRDPPGAREESHAGAGLDRDREEGEVAGGEAHSHR